MNLARARWSVAASVRDVDARGAFHLLPGGRPGPLPPFGGHNNDANQGLPA